MPEITVSETLHAKLEDTCVGDEFEADLWEMVYRYERCNGAYE